MDGDLALFTIPWKQEGENVTEELRVSVNTFKGQQYFAVRVWFQGRDGGKFFPGKSGINVPLDKMDEFVRLVEKGATRVKALAQHGHVDLPRTKVKRVRSTPSRPGTPEEEQLQRESDERDALNERGNAARD